MGGRFSPDAQARGNGHEVFQAGVLTAGSGGQEEEDLSRQVFNMVFSFRSVRVGQTRGEAAQQPPPEHRFPDESAYAYTHIGK